jgi:hypothetical protein
MNSFICPCCHASNLLVFDESVEVQVCRACGDGFLLLALIKYLNVRSELVCQESLSN